MTNRRATFIFLLLIALGLAVRLNNAWVFPFLRGYDAFGHFTYIWFISETGRIPLPTMGWSFFHPPLYYAFMAWPWKMLTQIDPVVRIKLGVAVIAAFTTIHAIIAFVIAKCRVPENRIAPLLAAGLMLFIPVQIYSVAFLGNEGLNAILCSVSLYLLFRALRSDSYISVIVLGVTLGLAMLTKLSSLAVVAGAVGTFGLRAVVRKDIRSLKLAATLGLIVTTLSGPFYGRNVIDYGTPFKLSRDEFMVQHVEHIQTKGQRGPLEYLLFDPVIFLRPQWPRGIPLAFPDGRPLPPTIVRSPLRESVWTGLYANSWFDGFGGWLIPRVTKSEISRRAGQFLLVFGLVPTFLILYGMFCCARRLARDGWEDKSVAALMTMAAMVVIFVHGTRVAPLHAAIKATYFMPVAVLFGYFLAIGADEFGKRSPRSMTVVVTVCLLLATTSIGIFTPGLIFPQPAWIADGVGQARSLNMYGIIYYAAGDRATARTLFERAAARNFYLAQENLAALALEDTRDVEALYRLRFAAKLQPTQSFGIPADRARFNRETLGDYLNSIATIYYRLGYVGLARNAATAAISRSPRLAEAYYNAGYIQLAAAQHSNSQQREILAQRAEHRFAQALAHDPTLREAVQMTDVAQPLTSGCEPESAQQTAGAVETPGVPHAYPYETGPGIQHSASIRRRRFLEPGADALLSEIETDCPGTASAHRRNVDL